jgi:hypothetical protein
MTTAAIVTAGDVEAAVGQGHLAFSPLVMAGQKREARLRIRDVAAIHVFVSLQKEARRGSPGQA